MDQYQLMEKRQWEALAQSHIEQAEIDEKVEVELIHAGHREYIYASMKKIAEGSTKDGLRTETWESKTKRNIPPRFTIVLGNQGSLTEHIEWCKYWQTVHGGRVIGRIAMILSMLLYIPFFAMAAGAIPSEINFLDWYWSYPMAFMISGFVFLGYFGRRPVAGRITLECAYPMDEQGIQHMCYIVGSKVLNVIGQLNQWVEFRDSFGELYQATMKGLARDNMAARERAWELEGENQALKAQANHQRISAMNDSLGQTQKARTETRTDWKSTILLLIAVGVVVGGSVWYMMG